MPNVLDPTDTKDAAKLRLLEQLEIAHAEIERLRALNELWVPKITADTVTIKQE